MNCVLVIPGRWNKQNMSAPTTALKLVNTIMPLFKTIICIPTNHKIPLTSDKIIQYQIFSQNSMFIIKKIIQVLQHQIVLSLLCLKCIIKFRPKIVIFCFGADLFLLPMFLCRLFGLHVVLRADGKPSRYVKVMGGKKLRVLLFEILEKIVHSIAYKIVLEHRYMINYFGYERLVSKIDCIPLYIDLNFFNMRTPIRNRVYDIAFMGRFSKEKGVIEFAKSLLCITEKSVNVLLVGNGELKEDVLDISKSSKQSIRYIGWVKHEDMSSLLNEIKLLVISSYKEGLPNLLIEAMACGTPVLATPIGAIPGVITDGETGFIMEDNSPECIAKNVVRALEHSDLERIVENARALVEQKFTYEKAVERWRKILEELS